MLDSTKNSLVIPSQSHNYIDWLDLNLVQQKITQMESAEDSKKAIDHRYWNNAFNWSNKILVQSCGAAIKTLSYGNHKLLAALDSLSNQANVIMSNNPSCIHQVIDGMLAVVELLQNKSNLSQQDIEKYKQAIPKKGDWNLFRLFIAIMLAISAIVVPTPYNVCLGVGACGVAFFALPPSNPLAK